MNAWGHDMILRTFLRRRVLTWDPPSLTDPGLTWPRSGAIRPRTSPERRCSARWAPPVPPSHFDTWLNFCRWRGNAVVEPGRCPVDSAAWKAPAHVRVARRGQQPLDRAAWHAAGHWPVWARPVCCLPRPPVVITQCRWAHPQHRPRTPSPPPLSRRLWTSSPRMCWPTGTPTGRRTVSMVRGETVSQICFFNQRRNSSRDIMSRGAEIN